ncbi:helix-turn-helix domain-containing protein [Crocosphaera sp. Alani8]|uniref:helix-turn-helix domain-containing protein n=1 Tax=Crocosphaera sp. Alani8 TaxID=3038952 RepID=UPI00313E7C4F
MKPYSLDLRQKIIEAYQNKEGSQRQLAKRFKVSVSFTQKLLKRYCETNEIEPRKSGKGFTARLEQHTQVVEKLVANNNDITLEELQNSLELETGVKLSISNICRFLQRKKLTRKKRCDPAPL